ncbi:MAG: hypothetical protein IPH20_01625 [Bacteroidales bacterium]|nr:hypothetical protein [Bacteroidales bacterium]
MKKTALLFLFFPLFGLAQNSMTQIDMKTKLDSILFESEILYKYEKTALSAIKFAESDKKMRKRFSEVFTYIDGDTVKAIILSKDRKISLSELSFFSDFNKPKTLSLKTRNLSEKELRLLTVRQLIYNDINNNGYVIKGIEGYDLHSILIPSFNGYKLYIITASKDKNVIPFGNDYLFISDKNGNVTFYEKFHSILLPTPITKNFHGLKLVSSMHAHLEAVPFITATDICTFRIYCENSEQKEFTVISTALNYNFIYDLLKNEIEIEEMPK